VNRSVGMLDLLGRAASLLLGDSPEDVDAPDARHVLEALGYATATKLPARDGKLDPERMHRARLLKAASRFARLFELAAPDAPGLICFGAELDPAMADPMHQGSPLVGVSGVGLSLQEAFQGCVGEGVEYLSQLQTAGDRLLPSSAKDQVAKTTGATSQFLNTWSSYRLSREAEPCWYRATRLTDGSDVLLPADLCLRRPAGQCEVDLPFMLGTGSAAGTSWDAAALHGLLELIERDGASLWWRGGKRGRTIPPRHEASLMADDLLVQLRANASTQRRSWLLDITTDLAVPCVAAVSCRPDGLGFAFGLAARPSLKAAVRSAVLEMCQIELAQSVAETKRRERGEAALNERDRVHLRRSTLINCDRCLLLQPEQPRTEQDFTEQDFRERDFREHLAIAMTDPRSVLQLIVRRLEEFGIEILGLDLTRPHLAIPAARMIAPGLQLEPSKIVTARLADVIARTGGGSRYTCEVTLI
jgi:ribosomal protein S12 methylthiotransferase accessory factor